MRMLLAAVAVAVAVPAQGQHHEGCPMGAPAAARPDAVDHRHQDATGIHSAATRHRFLLAEDGGSIQLEATDPADADTRDAVRTHLRHIARSFAEGDFSMPMRIHDRVPPGASTMKARRASIAYAYSDTPGGGRVTIRTADAEARAAVHEFLRFQIRDHRTGDPTE